MRPKNSRFVSPCIPLSSLCLSLSVSLSLSLALSLSLSLALCRSCAHIWYRHISAPLRTGVASVVGCAGWQTAIVTQCINIYVHAYIHTCVHTHIRRCIYTHTFAHIHTYMHKYSATHTNGHTLAHIQSSLSLFLSLSLSLSLFISLFSPSPDQHLQTCRLLMMRLMCWCSKQLAIPMLPVCGSSVQASDIAEGVCLLPATCVRAGPQ